MEDFTVSFLREAILIVCYVSAPTLLTALIVGFGISFFQAATQIQEQTLAYVPKIIAVFLVLAISISWMMQVVVRFASKVLNDFNSIISSDTWF